MEAGSEVKKIELDKKSLVNLNVSRKWAMFIAITGFIFLGLILIIGVISSTFLLVFKPGGAGADVPGILTILIFTVLTIAYFFPVFFLFRFSKFAKQAILTIDKKLLDKALKNLKLFFVYLGVFIIIVLLLYAFVLFLAGTTTELPVIMG